MAAGMSRANFPDLYGKKQLGQPKQRKKVMPETPAKRKEKPAKGKPKTLHPIEG